MTVSLTACVRGGAGKWSRLQRHAYKCLTKSDNKYFHSFLLEFVIDMHYAALPCAILWCPTIDLKPKELEMHNFSV